MRTNASRPSVIDGFGTCAQRLRRNWTVKPSWWEIDVLVPEHSPLYARAKTANQSFIPLRDEVFSAPVRKWLEANTRKAYKITTFGVRFQNKTDAMMFFLALR